MRHQHLDDLTGHPTCTFKSWAVVDASRESGVDATAAVQASLGVADVALDSTVDECRGYLAECGAWDDLDTASEDAIAERMVWVAACELRDERNDR